MSTAGWQESQEALQDAEGSQSKPSLRQGGVLKTEEVRVHHERVSLSDENSIELKPLSVAHVNSGKGADR